MLIHNEGILRLFRKHYIYVTISHCLEPQENMHVVTAFVCKWKNGQVAQFVQAL